MAISSDVTISDKPSSAPPQLPDGQWSPDTVLSTLSERPQQDSNSPIPFFHIIERLKTTKREGWRRFGIAQGESIADHMYRMAIVTMVAPESLRAKLDINRCTSMALVHDMAESLVGDITPVDGVSKPEKNRREQVTMDYLCKSLLGNVSDGVAGEHIRALWQEYEDSKTPESIFVHDIDKIELLLQMVEYEKADDGRCSLDEFAYVAHKVETEEIKEWALQLLEEQRHFWESKTGKKVDLAGTITNEDHKKMVDAYYAKQ